MTQSADGPEATPQPPHAPVQADEQAAEAGSSDGDQPAGDAHDAGQPQEVDGSGAEAPAVQHPSFDDAQEDPWGQAPAGEQSAPAPPWYGQGNGYPEQYAADPYYQGQVPGPFGQDQPQPQATDGQDHSRGAEGYTPGSYGQDPGPSGHGYPQGTGGRDQAPRSGAEGYARGRFGQKQVPAVDADDYASGDGQPEQGHGQQAPGSFGRGQAQGSQGDDHASGSSGEGGEQTSFGQRAPGSGGQGQPHGEGQGPGSFGQAYPTGAGAQGPYDQGQSQDAYEYGQQGYPSGGYGQEGEQYPQDPGYQQPSRPGLRPEVVNPFLEQSNAIPRRGMRRAVYRATFGAVNLGPSEEERAGRARRQRVARPLHGSWRVVVMSIKGGVGKTTTAAMLGRTLAEWRGDRVVALDTNPDMGTLGDRLVGATDVTVRGLLAHEARAPIQQVAEVNRFTNLAGRLHVLANEQDPAVSEDFTGSEYQQTLDILERFYNVIIADCGTGVLRPWVRDMLALANTLVVIAEPKGDAATRAAGTLDWIAQHGFHDLVARSVAVINYRSPTPKSLDVDALTEFFAQRCRAVCKIRYDEHLDLGVQIQYDPIPDAPAEAYVADATKEDYLELAAIVADEFR